MRLNQLLISQDYKPLKCPQPYFEDIWTGKKTFEVRKNDKDFRVGDIVCLYEEVEGIGTPPAPRTIFFEITYVLEGGKFGVESGYCAFGFNIFPETYQESFSLSSSRIETFWLKDGPLVTVPKEEAETYLLNNLGNLRSYKIPVRGRRRIKEGDRELRV